MGIGGAITALASFSVWVTSVLLIPAGRHDALKYVLEVVVMLDLVVVGLSEPDGCD